MENEDRLQRLKDIEWAFKSIEKLAVEPSKYRKSHQARIMEIIHVTSSQVQVLINNGKPEQERQK